MLRNTIRPPSEIGSKIHHNAILSAGVDLDGRSPRGTIHFQQMGLDAFGHKQLFGSFTQNITAHTPDKGRWYLQSSSRHGLIRSLSARIIIEITQHGFTIYREAIRAPLHVVHVTTDHDDLRRWLTHCIKRLSRSPPRHGRRSNESLDPHSDK